LSQYLLAIHRPDNYNGLVVEDEAMTEGIDALNREMVAAGIRVFVGGLQSERLARSISVQADGQIVTRVGPYLQTSEHVGGFWVLDVASLDDALAWGSKAAVACRAPVEVRPFF